MGSACGCKKSNKLSKLVYVLIFLFSAAFGIALRYRGEAILGSWVASMKVCDDESQTSKCWGIQACYRVSATVCGFFVVLIPIVACYPPAHLGGWFLKVLLYVAMLFISLAIPNHFYDVYADIARYASILFIIAQVIILVDFSYKIHEFLIRKIEERDAQFEKAGLCSNCWKILYMFLSFAGFAGSIAALAVMGVYFGHCSLTQFFLSETGIMGLICIVISLTGRVNRGLLPPCIIFAYTTYLCYGAITNNPDQACNPVASTDAKFTTSIIIGTVVAVLAVTWAAYSSAGSMVSVIESDEAHAAAVSARGGSSPVKSWGKTPRDGDDDEESTRNVVNPASNAPDLVGSKGKDADDEPDIEEGSAAAYASTGSTPKPVVAVGPSAAAVAAADARPPRKVWLFHFMMALGGIYLSMVLTNWGDADKVTTPTSNPEISLASMWVRIVSQWLIHILFIWTMVAPICCPGREFV